MQVDMLRWGRAMGSVGSRGATFGQCIGLPCHVAPHRDSLASAAACQSLPCISHSARLPQLPGDTRISGHRDVNQCQCARGMLWILSLPPGGLESSFPGRLRLLATPGEPTCSTGSAGSQPPEPKAQQDSGQGPNPGAVWKRSSPRAPWPSHFSPLFCLLQGFWRQLHASVSSHRLADEQTLGKKVRASPTVLPISKCPISAKPR